MRLGECSDGQGLREEAVEARMGLEGAAADRGGGFAEAHGGHGGDCEIGVGAREVVCVSVWRRDLAVQCHLPGACCSCPPPIA